MCRPWSSSGWIIFLREEGQSRVWANAVVPHTFVVIGDHLKHNQVSRYCGHHCSVVCLCLLVSVAVAGRCRSWGSLFVGVAIAVVCAMSLEHMASGEHAMERPRRWLSCAPHVGCLVSSDRGFVIVCRAVLVHHGANDFVTDPCFQKLISRSFFLTVDVESE
jgi:hypothetical protein